MVQGERFCTVMDYSSGIRGTVLTKFYNCAMTEELFTRENDDDIRNASHARLAVEPRIDRLEARRGNKSPYSIINFPPSLRTVIRTLTCHRPSTNMFKKF